MDPIYICNTFVGLPSLWIVLDAVWLWTTSMDELDLILPTISCPLVLVSSIQLLILWLLLLLLLLLFYTWRFFSGWWVFHVAVLWWLGIQRP